MKRYEINKIKKDIDAIALAVALLQNNSNKNLNELNKEIIDAIALAVALLQNNR
jgi:hypothetical protein